MTGYLDQVRRLDRAERRWLADAKDRLARLRVTEPAPTSTAGKADR